MEKLLISVDERKMGGVSILLEDYLRNLDLAKYDVTLLILHNNGNRFENIPQNIKKIYLDKYYNYIDIDVKTLIMSGEIGKAVRKTYNSVLMKTGKIKKKIEKIREKEELNGYDIEIAFKGGFCTLFAAYGDSKRKVNWVHEDYRHIDPTAKYRKIFNNAYGYMEKIVVVSEDAMLSFNEIYHLESKTTTIMNYIDEKRIISMAETSIKSQDSQMLENDIIKFISVGRLVWIKGFDRIILAAKMLKFEGFGDRFKVQIVGGGPLKNYLHKIINDNNLQDNVKLVGSTDNPYGLIKSSDVYILSSLSESFGMVRVESLILGVPIITTDVSCTEQILQGKYGLKVDNSLEGVYSGMREILTNPELFKNISSAVQKYSYADVNKEIIQKIQLLLEGKN